MFRRNDTSRTFVALAAAFVLVLQSFATAWASGAMPAPAMLDQFGNPLCITSADQPRVDLDGSGPVGDHSMPNCCTLGCSMGSSLLATPADDSGTWLSVWQDAAEADFLSVPAILVALHDYDPGNPRAPPLTA